MQLYWKCEECDETNAYPSVKVCETCGAPMSAAAEQRVLREQKEEERRQAQLKKEQERRRKEELRAKQEADRRRREAAMVARKAEEERQRLAELEQKLKKKAAREAKFGSFFRKASRFCTGVVRALAVIVIVLGLVFIRKTDRVNFDYSLSHVSNNIQTEYMAHTIMKANNDNQLDYEERFTRVLAKIGDQLSVTFDGVLSNVEEQFQYIQHTYTPWDNLVVLFEDIVEFLSEGVKK